MGLFDVRELRQLRDENARLNPLVADLTRDRQVLQELINKDLATPRGREIAQWIRNLATARPRFDYERIHVLLRREGWEVNPKRVHRLYKLDGLHLRVECVGEGASACTGPHHLRLLLAASIGQWILFMTNWQTEARFEH